jgi:hypothetical protein
MTTAAVTRWEEPTPGTVDPRDVVDGWAVTFAEVARLAEFIAGTEFVPKAYRGQPAAVTAAILTGRELGLGPMASLHHLHVIEGRPGLYAEAMRGLVFAHGHGFTVLESTSTRCTVTGRRRGENVDREPVTWTGEEVRRAQLANRPQWQKYPRAMLLARATAEFCRAVFPDVLGGMLAVEEAADIPADGVADAPTEAPARTVRRRAAATPTTQPRPHPTDAGSTGGRAEDAGPPSPSLGTVAPPTPDTTHAGVGDLPPLPEDGPAITEAAPEAAPEDAGGVTVGDPPENSPADDDATDEATGRQRGHVFALLTELGVMTPRTRRLAVVSALIGRDLESMGQLTRGEATPLIDTLIRVRDGVDPEGQLEALVAHGTARVVLGAEEVPLPMDGDAP